MSQTLTAKYRPHSFDDVFGQNLVKSTLKAIARKPDNVTRSIILSGPFGTGKTTMARILARAINCEKHNGDACGKCENCKTIIDGSSLCCELDSAVIGNKEAILALREQFAYSVRDGYRIVIIDEGQLVSKPAQGALLKVLEEAPKGIFFVFCTTDAEGLIPTIHSRSLVLELMQISDEEMKKLITKVANAEGISLTDTICDFIIRRVSGHARDCVQQLERLRLLGQEQFSEQAVTLDNLFKNFFNALNKNDKEGAKKICLEIVQNPVLVIKQDFDVFIREVADKVFLTGNVHRSLRELVMAFLKNHRFLVTSNDWYLFFMSLSVIFEAKR